MHAENFGVNFRTDRDEYVACCVEGEPSRQPIVGEYGVSPIFTGKIDAGYWQVNFMLPPGLPPGWHPVRAGRKQRHRNRSRHALRYRGTRHRQRATAVSWEQGRMSLANGFLSVWVQGLPRNADVHNVKAYVDGERQQVTYVGADGQINLRLSAASPLASMQSGSSAAVWRRTPSPWSLPLSCATAV